MMANEKTQRPYRCVIVWSFFRDQNGGGVEWILEIPRIPIAGSTKPISAKHLKRMMSDFYDLIKRLWQLLLDTKWLLSVEKYEYWTWWIISFHSRKFNLRFVIKLHYHININNFNAIMEKLNLYFDSIW